VNSVLRAMSAELFVLDPSGLLLLVLRGRVVPSLALGALQRDDVPHSVASWLVFSRVAS
jgi:hypothetical protein